jgi:hypothetical protein
MRRTSTIDTVWPEGYGAPMVMTGQARDVWTSAEGGAPVVVAQDHYIIVATPRREILSIEVTPDRPQAQKLVGIRAGGESRAALAQIMETDRIDGTPLYLILDDFAGASLVAGWVWSRWVDDWGALAEKAGLTKTAGRGGNMEGVCAGFAPGSSALFRSGPSMDQNCAMVPSLVNPQDPDGWHALGIQDGVGMRRARCIDVWRDDGDVVIDVSFQDSGTSPDAQPNSGERIAIHEYNLIARAQDGILTELKVDAHILPFQECPGAIIHAQRMLGTPLSDLRNKVLESLSGTLGCTHLNDVLRSMAEIPQLLRQMSSE